MLRHRELVTAAQLASELEVSERTIYRDVADLAASGVPVEGEAGMGYRLRDDFELPPLMFNKNEIQALVLGARMVVSWGDDELHAAAKSALGKVEAVLPPDERARVHDTALFAASFHVPADMTAYMADLRRAIETRSKVRISYDDRKGQASERVLRPLGLYFWGSTWTLAAWCELREDYRNFRLDRIEFAELLSESFELRAPVTLEDMLRSMTRD
jgi:predicted DNA-binding transcriptional regulator YafY